MALAERAAEADEPGGLVGLLDALGDDLEPERPPELDDRPGDGRPVGAGRHPGDERAVDLERVDGEPLEITQRRVAGPEVVDRQVRAERSQLFERVDGAVGALHEAALGDLEDEAGRRELRLREDRPDRLDEVVLAELAGRQVDADLQMRETQAELPLAQLAAGLTEDPLTHRDDVAGLFGDVDELARHPQRPVRRLPPNERLETDHGAADELDDRMIVEAELAALFDAAELSGELAASGGFGAIGRAEDFGAAAR